MLRYAAVADTFGVADGGQRSWCALGQVKGLRVGEDHVVRDAFAARRVAAPDHKPLIAGLGEFGLLRKHGLEGRPRRVGVVAGMQGSGRLGWAGRPWVGWPAVGIADARRFRS